MNDEQQTHLRRILESRKNRGVLGQAAAKICKGITPSEAIAILERQQGPSHVAENITAPETISPQTSLKQNSFTNSINIVPNLLKLVSTSTSRSDASVQVDIPADIPLTYAPSFFPRAKESREINRSSRIPKISYNNPSLRNSPCLRGFSSPLDATNKLILRREATIPTLSTESLAHSSAYFMPPSCASLYSSPREHFSTISDSPFDPLRSHGYFSDNLIESVNNNLRTPIPTRFSKSDADHMTENITKNRSWSQQLFQEENHITNEKESEHDSTNFPVSMMILTRGAWFWMWSTDGLRLYRRWIWLSSASYCLNWSIGPKECIDRENLKVSPSDIQGLDEKNNEIGFVPLVYFQTIEYREMVDPYAGKGESPRAVLLLQSPTSRLQIASEEQETGRLWYQALSTVLSCSHQNGLFN